MPKGFEIESSSFNETTANIVYDLIIKSSPGYRLWGITFIIITLFGIIGNILTILVLRREATASTLTILLTGLAISDLIAPQANCLIAIIYYHLYPLYQNSVYFFKVYSFINYIIQPLSTAFTMSSSWIITITTLFRLIVVCKPFKARTLINKELALISLAVIFSLSLLTILPIYFSLETVKYCTEDKQNIFTVFGQKQSSQGFIQTYYILILQILCFYLPWITSASLWIFLIRALKKAEMKFASYATSATACIPQQPKSSITNYCENRRQNIHHRLTYMVILLCFMNLTCQLCTFVFIFELIHNANSTLTNAKQKYPHFMAYTFLFNNIFLGLNHSCNIFIYILTNPKFRANLVHLLSCGFKKRLKRDQHEYSHSLRHINTTGVMRQNTIIRNTSPTIEQSYLLKKFSLKFLKCK